VLARYVKERKFRRTLRRLVRPRFSEGATGSGSTNIERRFVAVPLKMTPANLQGQRRVAKQIAARNCEVGHRAGERAAPSSRRISAPYEAVILHLCVQAQPDIPVLWVDHGYNRPATYQHAEQLKKLLKLNLKPFLPKITAAHRDAIYGEIPTTDDEAGLKQFSALDEARTVPARHEGTRADGLDHGAAQGAKSESRGTRHCREDKISVR
jgi:hypothetical protein